MSVLNVGIVVTADCDGCMGVAKLAWPTGVATTSEGV